MPKGRQIDEKMKFMGFILMTALFLPYTSYFLTSSSKKVS